ncbi:MAG: MATE family efflux transporter [Cetobacterium sp.]|uniref:MATE family efflux transporter n=1 Tax=Cetobacterium sp. TaxID=2071632 RepID=UPI003F31AC15
MFKEFINYAIPSVFAMFVSSLYVIIDGIFVGRGVGSLALGAVNLVLPISIFFFGIASMFAVGGGTLISESFGNKNIQKGVAIFRETLLFLLILSSLLSGIFFIFSKEIIIFLGASDSILELANTYLKYYVAFCIPNIIGIALSSFIRNDSNPKLAMIATISGAALNIILDYIFIFIFHLGIKGAAIATGLGQILTVLIILLHFLFKKGHLSFGKSRLYKENILNFIRIGFPSFFMEITFSIIVFCMNIAILKIGNNNQMASFGIINYLTTIVYMLLLGLSFGIQPLFSFNYGANNSEKVRKFYKFTILSSLFINFIYFIITFFFGNEIIGLFTKETTILKETYIGLFLFNISFFIIGINVIQSGYYQAINDPGKSNIISCLRSFIFFPITLFVLSRIWGLNGIWLSTLFSETFVFFTWKILFNENYNFSFITSKNNTI